MSRLIIPTSAALHGKQPVYKCTLCDWQGYDGEGAAYQRHAMSHSIEELREHSLKAQAPGLFDPYWEGGDVEWQRWIDKNNAERPEDWMRWMKTSE